MFDENAVNTEFIPPREISSVVFTIQHHERYIGQAYKLLRAIKERFPLAKNYVVHHSTPNIYSKQVASYGCDIGFVELPIYGDSINLDFYDDIDLHIGYRLHGHISFLRRRKPSILMVEDARAYGFANTQGTAFGCIEAMCLKTMLADMSAPDRAMELLDSQIGSEFSEYHMVFNFIDETYKEFIEPYFSNLAQRL